MTEVRREWLDRDYYKDLGLTQAASDDDIKSAYKKLVRKLHPDRNPGNKRAEDRFKEVSSAYEVIGDSKTRAQYDQVRQIGTFDGEPSGSTRYHTFNVNADDILSNLFSRSGGFPRQGTDYETSAKITFDQAMSGVMVEVDGLNQKTIRANIPAGVKDRARIKIPGKGGPGANGGADGDLYVEVSVSKHDVYERKGNNLLIEVPISFWDATLGTNLKVPTYSGQNVEIKIPEGTSSGTKFKIREQGAPFARGKKGDLIVKVEVEIPKELTTEQKCAVRELSQAFNGTDNKGKSKEGKSSKDKPKAGSKAN